MVFSGVKVSEVVEGSSTRPCTHLCKMMFSSKTGCVHDLKYCASCNELWVYSESSTKCPRVHKEERNSTADDSIVDTHLSLLIQDPFNLDDDTCDELCTYTYDVLQYDRCRHDLVRCINCPRIWDGQAQCDCIWDERSGDDEVSDEEKREPKAKKSKADTK